ncbi:putative coiled-coil protein SlyX [Edaphobacter lichenicola]|uniref:Coiled-coil protein SlyX n=2 Tax=Tunturiibacter gelidiferens TaxID=3069689 RepID=A0A9X0U697_9BACT|nr:putative coiled-coil protein SlyX [Edaphobacter lichenicola]
MENEVSVLARDIDKAPNGEAVIERLLSAQIKVQRLFALADAKIAQQDVTIAEQNAKIAALMKLVDSHQAELEILRMRQQGGIVQ